MSGKLPNLKKLRNMLNDFDTKLSNKRSQTPVKSLEIDEELHSALKTRPKNTKKKSYDKDLLSKAKLEIEQIDMELGRCSPDDLCLSSESEQSKLSSSFRLTKSSAFSLAKASQNKFKVNNLNLGNALEKIKKLEKIIAEKEEKITTLERMLIEKQKVAETSTKKLSQTAKLIKNNEKEISL